MKKKDYERLERIFSYNNIMIYDLERIGEQLNDLYLDIVKKQDFLNYLKNEYIPFLGQRKQFALDNYPSSGRTTLIRVFFNDVIDALTVWIEEKQIFFDYPDGVISFNPDLDEAEQNDQSIKNNLEKEKEKSYSAKVYALSYFLDCKAAGFNYLNELKQAELETTLHKRYKQRSGNTIRKALGLISNEKQINLNLLENVAGKDWRQTMFDLTKDGGKLDIFLKSKNL